MLPSLCLLGVFIIPLTITPFVGDGWFWEVGNALGFLGLSIMLILTLNGRNKGGHSSFHRWIGFVCFFAIVGHALWFILGDKTTLEYIMFGAPTYMVLGVLSIVLIIILIFTSLLLFRKSTYRSHSIFSKWHRYLSFVMLIASTLHVGLSGYYFVNVIQWSMMIGLIISVYFFQERTHFKKNKQKLSILLLFSGVLLSAFVIIRNGIL
jgi:DMSO/TMAO reductase YedYZ heme-binding membrane subunit